MKFQRSYDFNTSHPKIWEKSILKLGDGPLFISKVVITGFGLCAKKIHFGPITLRQYDQKKDEKLGSWSGRCCVLELKFQDLKLDIEQKFPVSTYLQPYWIVHSIFLALQVYADSWIGMMPAHHFDSKGKLLEHSGGGRTTVADSRSITKEPVIKRLYKKLLLKCMNAQFGKLELAIDRYSRACTEIVYESIIDFVIVLENLLGIGLGSEISHRVSLRGAILLSPNPNTRKQYYIAIRYFYYLRSKMVHGDIDEIKSPSTLEKRQALINLGANLSDEGWEDRYEISNIARELTRSILIYFVNHEDQWNSSFLENLELGIKNANLV